MLSDSGSNNVRILSIDQNSTEATEATAETAGLLEDALRRVVNENPTLRAAPLAVVVLTNRPLRLQTLADTLQLPIIYTL